MIVIDTAAAMARAIDQPIDQELRRLLVLRRDQLVGHADAARFLVVEPGDNLGAVEAAVGFPLVQVADDGVCPDEPDKVPFWEWERRHGGWTELCFVLSDHGVAEVLLLPRLDNLAPDLAALIGPHLLEGEGTTAA